MTIKKIRKVPAAPAPSAEMEPVADMPAAGGSATIADRFKLDVPEQPKKSAGGIGATLALVAALVALGVAGVLAFTIYQHWEFLKGA